jgi:hypothetical protein
MTQCARSSMISAKLDDYEDLLTRNGSVSAPAGVGRFQKTAWHAD